MRREWPVPWRRQGNQESSRPIPSATRRASLLPTLGPGQEIFAHKRKISGSIPPRFVLPCRGTRENRSGRRGEQKTAAAPASRAFASSASLPLHPAVRRAPRRWPVSSAVRRPLPFLFPQRCAVLLEGVLFPRRSVADVRTHQN